MIKNPLKIMRGQEYQFISLKDVCTCAKSPQTDLKDFHPKTDIRLSSNNKITENKNRAKTAPC